MADWQNTIDLSSVWASEDIQLISSVIVENLKRIKIDDVYLEARRQELIDEFEILAGDPSADVEDFDSTMSDLYDWGDVGLDAKWGGKRVCWITTR